MPKDIRGIQDIDKIYDKDMNVIDAARHSQMKVIFYSDIPLEQFDLIR